MKKINDKFFARPPWSAWAPKIKEKLMGINGNSCYKTHYFLNTNLTIIGEFDNSGKMDEHKSIE